MIDVVLDGADALKAMILQLKDEIENQPFTPLNIDLAALDSEDQKPLKKGKRNLPSKKKLGEILVNDGIVTTG